MRLACPSCLQAYDFPVELLADEPFVARCSVCRSPFLIGPAGVVDQASPASTLELGPEALASDESTPEAPSPEAAALPAQPTGIRIALIRADPEPARSEEPEGEYLIVRGQVRERVTGCRRVAFVCTAPRP